MTFLIKLFYVASIICGSTVAFFAEQNGNAAQILIGVIVIAAPFTSLIRRVRPNLYFTLPWLVLALTYFVPFLPGIYSAYPPTRYLFVIALGAFWAEMNGKVPKNFSMAMFLFLVLWMSLLLLRSYLVFKKMEYGYDLAHILNILHNTVQGDFLYSDYTGASILSHHLFITLVALTPLYVLYPDPFFPQVVQIVLMGLSVVLVTKAATQQFGESGGIFAFFCFLLHPAFQGQALHEFDPGVIGMFGTSLALFGFARSDYTRNNYGMVLVGAIIAVLSKEHFSVACGICGFLLVFQSYHRPLGIALIIISLVSLGAFFFISHSVSGPFDLATQTSVRFGPDGLNPASLAKEALRAPKVGFLLHMLIPSGMLSILGFTWLLPALPEIGLAMVSHFPMAQTSSHYATLSLPFLAMSAAAGASRLKTWAKHLRPNIDSFTVAVAVAASVFAMLGPISHTGAFYDVIFEEPSAEARQLRTLVNRLPVGTVGVLGNKHRLLVFFAEREPAIPLPYIDVMEEVLNKDFIILDDYHGPRPENYTVYDQAGSTIVLRHKGFSPSPQGSYY